MTRRACSALATDRRGSIAVETALILPVLATLTFGVFEAGSIFARQQVLQNAALEGETIALAINQGAEAELSEIADVIVDTAGLSSENVAVTRFYRCDVADTRVTTPNACAIGVPVGSPLPLVSTYLEITLTDRYTPSWTQFGMGRPIDYNIKRTVQIS